MRMRAVVQCRGLASCCPSASSPAPTQPQHSELSHQWCHPAGSTSIGFFLPLPLVFSLLVLCHSFCQLDTNLVILGKSETYLGHCLHQIGL